MNSDEAMSGMLVLGIVVGICAVFLFQAIVFEQRCESDNNIFDCTMQYVPTEVTPDATN
jgi:hypothetical protein